MGTARVLVLCDREAPVSTFIVDVEGNEDFETTVNHLGAFAEANGLQLWEMGAPQIHTTGELGIVESEILDEVLKRKVARAPCEADALKKLSRFELCELALGLKIFNGSPSFETLSQEDMAARLEQELSARASAVTCTDG